MKYTLFIMLLLTAKLTNAEVKLGWEDKNPKNIEWTKITMAAVDRHFQNLDAALDAELFCPEYTFLDVPTKKHFWGEFISAMAFFESGWSSVSQLTEVTLGNDSVTGKTVTSEGLLQLSYGDIKWAKWCRFDWEKDQENNPLITSILNPKNNLECGIGILANQIRKQHKIVLEKKAYWSILKINHKFQRIDKMRDMIVGRIPTCIKG